MLDKTIEEIRDKLIMVNGQEVAIIEVKHKVHKNELNKFIHRKYNNFKTLYPEYSNFKHHLFIAAYHISDTLIQHAQKNNKDVIFNEDDSRASTLFTEKNATENLAILPRLALNLLKKIQLKNFPYDKNVLLLPGIMIIWVRLSELR